METHNDEITIKELFDKAKVWYLHLLSQWKIILLAGIIGAIFGMAYSFINKPLYTASLTFALEDESSTSGSLGGAMGIASSLGLDVGGGRGGSAFTGTNLNELFKSRKIIERTLLQPIVLNGDSISLIEFYFRFNESKDTDSNRKLKDLHFPPLTKSKYFTRVQDSIIGVVYKSLIKNDLIIGPKEESSITLIEFRSENELFSKVFCEELVKEVSKYYIDTKSKKAAMNMAILIKQRDSIRAELNGGITGVAKANDDTFMLNPAMNINKATSLKKQIDVQSNTAILSELIKQTELAKVTLRKETPLIQVIDPPVLPLKKEKFSLLKGIIFGGFFGGFLTIIVLFFRLLLKNTQLE